jgi:hypothetical protein
VSVTEPMTLATDYLLAVCAAVFAVRLWRVHRMWALAFLFTAAGSFFGGTYHGFLLMLEPPAAFLLWKATLFSIGLASFFLLAGSGRGLAAIAVVKLVVYTTWMIGHDDFLWVIADYGVTLLIVGIVQLVRRGPSTPWVIGSIVVSAVASLLQQSGFALHRHFNHNDLYHVIQLAALWLLYRGGRLMNPSTAPPLSPPR